MGAQRETQGNIIWKLVVEVFMSTNPTCRVRDAAEMSEAERDRPGQSRPRRSPDSTAATRRDRLVLASCMLIRGTAPRAAGCGVTLRG